MKTQRTFEPHEFEAYAEAENICRHCDRGKYAVHHQTTEHDDHDAPAAPERGEQSRLFPRYTFAVVTGRYKILDNRSDSEPRVRQIATADGEDEARLIVDALNAAEQHSTLIAQRERLREALYEALSYIGAESSGEVQDQIRTALKEN